MKNRKPKRLFNNRKVTKGRKRIYQHIKMWDGIKGKEVIKTIVHYKNY